ARLDVPRGVLHRAHEGVRHPERHTAEPVEERDLHRRPAADRVDLREDREDDGEVEAHHERLAEQEQPERGAVLPAGTDLRPHQAAPDLELGGGLTHLGPPPVERLAPARRARSPRARRATPLAPRTPAAARCLAARPATPRWAPAASRRTAGCGPGARATPG